MNDAGRDQYHNNLLKYFEEHELKPIVEKFGAQAEALREVTMDEFEKAVQPFFTEAAYWFVHIIGMRQLSELRYGNSLLQIKLYTIVIGGLNSALSADHPYIISILNIDNEQGVSVVCIKRNQIPGHHDIVSRAIVPICNTKSREQFALGELWVYGVLYPRDKDELEDPDDKSGN